MYIFLSKNLNIFIVKKRGPFSANFKIDHIKLRKKIRIVKDLKQLYMCFIYLKRVWIFYSENSNIMLALYH